MNDMMLDKKKILELVDKAKNIAIIPSKVAGNDAFAASLGLNTIIKDRGRRSSVLYNGRIPEGFEDTVNSQDIISDVFERELIVSIDYSGTNASNVHYSTDNDILYLSVRPVDKGFDLSKIKSEIKGFDFDLIITIGAQGLEDFGSSFEGLKDEFHKSTIINIDNTSQNENFGDVDIIDPTYDSLSLLIMNESVNWGFKISSKAAKALIKGINHRNID